MKITLAQVNPVVGDMEGNLEILLRVLESLPQGSTDLVVLPELFLTGYPPMDLLEREWFIRKVDKAVMEVRRLSLSRKDLGILVGCPLSTGMDTGKGLFNSALLVEKGEILAQTDKCLLPTYDVFDEARYFTSASSSRPFPFRGKMIGVTICEDAWNTPELWPRGGGYTRDPVQELVHQGAEMIINISASPFSRGKLALRRKLLGFHAEGKQVPFIYLNQVGGNDELIFDGSSMVLDSNGCLCRLLGSFSEDIRTIDMDELTCNGDCVLPGEIENVHAALVLGIRDYLRKCGFSRSIVGLSGGIDSAVTAALAIEALGSGNVLGVSMPSPYSSRGSVDDSRVLAERLGMEFRVISISEIFSSFIHELDPHLENQGRSIAEENIQARIRGNILMALSNASGAIVLSTGNKSEMSMGYCTLYGDMSGGLSVLSDVPKTMVYELAEHINSHSELIPGSIISKAPSAELSPGQKDSDSLPPYPVLDRIIQLYVEELASEEEILKEGVPPEVVKGVIRSIENTEYKRKQAAPGLKVTSKAFGGGRRFPVAARKYYDRNN